MTEQQVSERIAEIAQDPAVTRVSKPYNNKVYLTLRGYRPTYRGDYTMRVTYDLETGAVEYRVGHGVVTDGLWASIHDLESRRGATRIYA